MATKVNEILQFASQDTGSNLLTQSEYDGDAQRVIGHQPGIARSRLENKVLRQCSTMAAGVAEFMLRNQDGSVTDGMSPQEVADALTVAIGGASGAKMNRATASIIPNASQTNVTTVIPNNLYSLIDIVGDSFTLTIGLVTFVVNSTQTIQANQTLSIAFDLEIEGKTPLTAPKMCCVNIERKYQDFTWTSASADRLPSYGGTFGFMGNGKLAASKNANIPIAGGTLIVFFAP